MNTPSNQQLMERVLNRLQADSKDSVTASSRELKHVTNQLIDEVRQMNAALSAPRLPTERTTIKQSNFSKR